MSLKSHKEKTEGQPKDPEKEKIRKRAQDIIKSGNIDIDNLRKRPATFRLSRTTITELGEISLKEKVSQAEVIAVLVHSYFMGYSPKQAENYFDLARKL